jgi:hypothetical protein
MYTMCPNVVDYDEDRYNTAKSAEKDVILFYIRFVLS